MKKADQLGKALIADQATSMTNSGKSSRINPGQTQELSKDYQVAFAKAYRVLFGRGFVSFGPNDTDYSIWERDCADLTADELQRGVKDSKDFRGSWFKLSDFRAFCRPSLNPWPEPKTAYIEACNMPSPKDKQKWSHPLVYYAGKATGWSDLHAWPEYKIFPRFRANYLQLINRMKNGEDFSLPVHKMIEEKKQEPLSREENQTRMADLKRSLKL